MTSLSLHFWRGFGVLAVASLLSASAQAQTTGCQVGSANGGPIPTAGTGGGGNPPTAPLITTLSVPTLPPSASVVTELKLIGLTHTYAGDLQFVLTDPAGNMHNIVRQPSTYCDYAGDYTIIGQCTGGQPFPTCTTGLLTPGIYEQHFGNWASGNLGINNTPLNSIPAQTGTWTLTCYDWLGGDIGFLTSWDLCFGTAPAPSAPAATATLTSPANGTSVVLPATLAWTPVTCASSYDIDIDGTITTGLALNSFVVNSATVGLHTWTVRGVSAAGAGPWATPSTFDVPPPPPASTCTTNGAGAGPVPATGTGGGGVYPNTFPPSPYTHTYNVTVPPGATQIVKVQFDFPVPHTYAFDLQFVLTDPSGVGHNIFCRTSGGCNLNGAYSIYETAGLSWPTSCPTGDVPAGDYDQYFGTWPSGTNNVFNTPLSQIPILSGNWTLTIYDWAGADIGTLGDWSLCFDAPSGPVAYCTPGTTTNGCTADISASSNPSASQAGTCVINVTDVEGQKSGLIFYSASGQLIQAWNSTSYLCVKAPIQRTPTQTSTGTVGQCDGTLTLDWNAFQAANPTAVGNPWVAGNQAWVQAWFRDPPAGKSTNLSNAIEMTYIP